MLRIAVDVGGTFTDLVALDEETGETWLVKVSSTPEEPEAGALRSLELFFSKCERSPARVRMLLHVGTIGTNLFRGQMKLKMPKTALITTRGFRDVLEIGRQNRPLLYDVFFEKPPPLVPRNLRFEVSERVDAKGNVTTLLDTRELNGLAESLLAEGVESVAVVFLHSYLNPSHEREAEELLSARLHVPISASHRVNNEFREFERTSTTVINAILAPTLALYLALFKGGAERLGLRCPLLVMGSAGGLLDVDTVREKPVAALESGPAAGVIGAAALAEELGLNRVLCLDMGGTTAKAGTVLDFQPLTVPEFEIGGLVHAGRIVKGSGYVVRHPCIDLAEVSAGGGTVIWVDAGGALNVGPKSAGARPGPACYGLGGLEPTVTDANVAVGRLGSELLGGELKLQPSLAREALRRVGEEAGLSVEAAALGGLSLVNLHMARALRLVSLERGLDPKEFSLVAFGGCGPLHAIELAEALGVGEVIVPPAPGLFSALGLLRADIRYDYTAGFISPLERLDPTDVEGKFASMESEALRKLASQGFGPGDVWLLRSMDLRYRGQGYELTVPASRPFTETSRSEVAERFHEKHREVYGYATPAEPVEATALRLAAVGRAAKPKTPIQPLAGEEPPPGSLKERRQCFTEQGLVEFKVYDRSRLRPGNRVKGPAIIEQYDSTTLIGPGWSATVDQRLNLRLRRET